MPAGDWWVVDPVGGNLNAIQGTPDWNIGVSLVPRRPGRSRRAARPHHLGDVHRDRRCRRHPTVSP